MFNFCPKIIRLFISLIYLLVLFPWKLTRLSIQYLVETEYVKLPREKTAQPAPLVAVPVLQQPRQLQLYEQPQPQSRDNQHLAYFFSLVVFCMFFNVGRKMLQE